MAYTKATDFAAKDALTPGDPAKVIKGTEIGAEFDAIQSADALNLKRDGTSTASANIPMGGKKFTGLGAGTAAGDSVRYEQFASPPAIGSTTASPVRGTTVTATTQFSGPGTGLTGTAASLSIGGNAATATSATSATSATTAATATDLAGGSAGKIPYQTGSGATSFTAAGTTSQVLIGGTAPSFQTAQVVRQVVDSSTGALVSVTTGTVIPFDDTIPQITEGGEVMTVSITPQNAGSTLVIDVLCNVSVLTSADGVTVALFKNSGANAIAATNSIATTTNTLGIYLSHTVAAGGTAAQTYRVRIGRDTAGFLYLNGVGGGRKFGGVCMSFIRVTEYLP